MKRVIGTMGTKQTRVVQPAIAGVVYVGPVVKGTKDLALQRRAKNALIQRQTKRCWRLVSLSWF